jgi:hypothetical protein
MRECKELALRFGPRFITAILFVVVLCGCEGKPPPTPTPAEAAKAPPLTPPKGADNARAVSD